MTGTTSLLQVAEQAGMKPEDAKKASGGILELLKASKIIVIVVIVVVT
jgi:hypothetical protein